MPYSRSRFVALVLTALVAFTTCAATREPARAVTASRSAQLRRPEIGFDCGTAHFWTDGSTGRTWAQARAMCRSLGGDLASIRTEEERVCANRVLTQVGAPPVGAWIGLFENQQEGAWRWSDGTPIDFAAWKPGEPNNDSGTANDCGHIWRDEAFAWNDIPCPRTDPSFLCRIP